MSWQRRVLNVWLKQTEKRFLARGATPADMRRRLEARARFWFRAPRGVRVEKRGLGEAALPALWVDGSQNAGVLLYFHGGGYVFGSPATHAAMLARLAGSSGMRACLPEYRLAPEHPFPAALEDARAAYGALVVCGIAPDRIVIGGDSAGGGLALALLGDLLAHKAPLPAGVFGLSPLTDLTFSGDSLRRNAEADVILAANRADDMSAMYLRGHDPADPLVSPLFADFSGASDIWLCVGDSEILLDDTTRLARRLQQQGVAVTSRIAHDLPHVWPIFQCWLPEADATLDDLAGWIRQRVPSAGES
jgi:epsilon-lactone hydrolase